MQTYTTLKPIIYGTFIHLFVRIKVQHKLVSGFWTGVPVPKMTFFWIFRFFSNRLDLCFKLTEYQKNYYQRKAWDISLQKTPILHILADSLDGNRKKTYPYPTKNHQNCKNYTFQFLSKPQRIETGQILTVFVLLVVGKGILSRFGDRKSVFVVRNYEKWWFWGIFDFPKKWRSKDNAKQIMQFE